MGRFIKKPKINWDSRQKHFFDGIMAGDGCIYTPSCRTTKQFTISSCYREFPTYVVDYLNLDVCVSKSVVVDDRMIDGYFVTYRASKQNIIFNKEYNRWYEHGKKTIPGDFNITPESLCSLYLSDGKLHKSGSIHLCIESFSGDLIENIIIKQLCGIGIKAKLDSRNRVYISVTSKNIFFDFIGDCPVQCYGHKWDRACISKKHKVWTDRIRSGLKTKLSCDIAKEIRIRYLLGDIGILQLAKKYSVHDKTIRDVIYNKSWPDKNYDESAAKLIAKSKRFKSNII